MSDLLRLEKEKAHFLKRMLGVATTAPNRLVYELSKEPFFIRELRTMPNLPSTTAEQKHLEIKRKQKRRSMDRFLYIGFHVGQVM